MADTSPLHTHCEQCYKASSCKETPCPPFSCDITSCALGCGAKFHGCKTSEHIELCPRGKVPCINEGNGCHLMLPRWQRGVHLQTCAASVIYCTMEWNRWPVFSQERQAKVPFSGQRVHARYGQLDVALALRDQRMLNKAMNVPRSTRRALRSNLTRRFPAVPIMHQQRSIDSAFSPQGSTSTSCTVSDDDSDAPWQQRKHPPGLKSSVCYELFRATKKTTESLTAALNLINNPGSEEQSVVSDCHSPVSDVTGEYNCDKNVNTCVDSIQQSAINITTGDNKGSVVSDNKESSQSFAEQSPKTGDNKGSSLSVMSENKGSTQQSFMSDNKGSLISFAGDYRDITCIYCAKKAKYLGQKTTVAQTNDKSDVNQSHDHSLSPTSHCDSCDEEKGTRLLHCDVCDNLGATENLHPDEADVTIGNHGNHTGEADDIVLNHMDLGIASVVTNPNRNIPHSPDSGPMLQELLGLDLNIEQITRYQPKPSSMYTFLCAQFFRRDEYPWHFKNLHGDIHAGMNGWLEQRCPLAYTGCTFSQRRLYPGNRGAELVYSNILESFGVRPYTQQTLLNTRESIEREYLEYVRVTKGTKEPTPEIFTSKDFDAFVKIHGKIQPSGVTNGYRTSCSHDNNTDDAINKTKECSECLLSQSEAADKLRPDLLTSLPFEILRHIAWFLDGFSMNNLSLTCKSLRDVCCSLLDEKGIVVQEWERSHKLGQVHWYIAYQRWLFSTCFDPIQTWGFIENQHISEHLKTCPFYQREPDCSSAPFKMPGVFDKDVHQTTKFKDIMRRMYPDNKEFLATE